MQINSRTFFKYSASLRRRGCCQSGSHTLYRISYIQQYSYVQQRGKKTLLSLTLICYCHLVGMAKIVRGSTLYDHETPLLDDLADLLYIKYGIAFSSFVF